MSQYYTIKSENINQYDNKNDDRLEVTLVQSE